MSENRPAEPQVTKVTTVGRAVAWRSIHNFLTNPAFIVPPGLEPKS